MERLENGMYSFSVWPTIVVELVKKIFFAMFNLHWDRGV